jgi:ABC-2 type transport system permease protein
MMRKLYTVTTFVKINTKRFFRDKTAIFFSILFPLIFLFVFGGIFGGNNDVSFRVALLSQSKTDSAAQVVKIINENKLFKVDPDITAQEAADEKMNRGQLDATIVIPPDFGELSGDKPTGKVQVNYTQNNQQAGQALGSILQEIMKSVNAQYVEVAMPFAVESKQSNAKSLSQFDYTFAGLLGFSIIGMGIFGPINIFPELKKMGILRRLHTTPIRVWQYFMSTVLSQLVVGAVTMVVLFAVAIVVFDLKVVGNIFELAIFLALSITSILGIGLALGGWAKNERQAAPLSNIIVFPMMFLSGTFFPRFLMPEWLQTASNYLPLTPVIDGIRLITTEGKHLTEIGPQLGLIGLWMIIVYAIAFRVFRWE